MEEEEEFSRKKKSSRISFGQLIFLVVVLLIGAVIGYMYYDFSEQTIQDNLDLQVKRNSALNDDIVECILEKQNLENQLNQC